MEFLRELTLEQLVVIVYVFYNIAVFFIFGLDKFFAIKQTQRISERTLFLLALFGGTLGAACGMKLWHHKTRKPSFIAVMLLILVVQLALIYWVHAGFPIGFSS